MQDTLEERGPRKRVRNISYFILVSVIGLLIILAIFALTKAGKVKVPNFVGQNFPEAQKVAAEKKILLIEQMRENSDSLPVGVILSQNPKEGSLIKENETVWVKVSKGRLTNVPRLIGFKKEDAPPELEKSGLRLGRIRTIPSDTIPRGRIINTSPPPDAEVEKGSSVDLIISSGPRVIPPPPVPTSFIRPTIQFQSLQVKEPDRRGFNLAVGLSVDNPNPSEGKMKGFYYKLEVGDYSLGSATYYCNYSLNPNGKTDILLNVNVRYDRLAKAAIGLMERGEVDYKVRGYYILEAGGGRSIEPVEIRGRFNLREKVGPFLRQILSREGQ